MLVYLIYIRYHTLHCKLIIWFITQHNDNKFSLSSCLLFWRPNNCSSVSVFLQYFRLPFLKIWNPVTILKTRNKYFTVSLNNYLFSRNQLCKGKGTLRPNESFGETHRAKNVETTALSWKWIRSHNTEKNPKGDPLASNGFVSTPNIETGTLL